MANSKNVDTKNSDPFIKRHRSFYQSPAWDALPYFAQSVLCRLELEHMCNAGKKNGQLIVTLDQFEARGFRRSSVSKAIRQCERLGFLEVVREGTIATTEGARRRPNKYRLTYVTDSTGKVKPTNEWASITSAEAAAAALKGVDRANVQSGNVVRFRKRAA